MLRLPLWPNFVQTFIVTADLENNRSISQPVPTDDKQGTESGSGCSCLALVGPSIVPADFEFRSEPHPLKVSPHCPV